MAKNFSELRAKMSPESKVYINETVKKILAEKTPLDIAALRSQVEAMGGQLEIVVRFPDGAVNTFNLAEYSKIIQ